MKDERLTRAMGLLDDELLEEAWNAAPKKKIIAWKPWTMVAAACLALLLTLRLWPMEPQLLVQGQLIDETPVLCGDAFSQTTRSREMPQTAMFSLEPARNPLTVEMEVKLKHRGSVEASTGILTLLQGNGQQTDTGVSGKGTLLLSWTVENAVPGKTYSITVPEKQYILAYDSTLEGWTIFEQKGE